MKGLMALICGTLGLLVLQACSSPALMSGNERGGIVSHANGTNQATAFTIADAHCHQFGRVAQVTGMDVLYNRLMFACVER